MAPGAAAPTATKEETPKFTRQFAELARREKADVERRAALKAEEAAVKEYREARELAEKDPVAAMAKFGLTPDQLVKALVASVTPPKEETVEDKVNRLEAERKAEKEAKVAAEQEAADKAVMQQVQTAKAEIRDFVTKAGDAYELVNAQDAHDAVFETIVEHWQSTGGQKGGEFLPFEKAAQLVEDYLLEEATKVVKGSKKVAKLLEAAGTVPPATPASSAPTTPPPRAAAPTLSQSSTGGYVPPEVRPPAAASHADVLKRILAKHAPKG